VLVLANVVRILSPADLSTAVVERARLAIARFGTSSEE